MYLCVLNELTGKVPERSVEKSEEPELEMFVSEPVSTSPFQSAEPEYSAEQPSEPIELPTMVSEVPPVPVELAATGDEAPVEQSSESVQISTMVSEVLPALIEPAAIGDEAPLPSELSVTPVVDLREDALASNDPNAVGVRIYTDTTEGVPQVERDVEETEEVLPDGTVVRRQVVRTSQRQTISTRVVMEGPEDILPSSKAEAEQLLGEMGVSEELGRQIATTDSEPQASTNVEEHEEVLPDGSVVKRRVVTTTKQHVTTERVSLEDDDIPAGNDRSA